ncbi:MAG: hypothetical protein Q7U59_04350 [Lutibacter sp.]|nr:hypothetical protein [Lutibacter sp.]
MKPKNEKESNKVSLEQIDSCIAILKKLVGVTNQVFALSEDKRIALLKADGKLTRRSNEEFSLRKKTPKNQLSEK